MLSARACKGVRPSKTQRREFRCGRTIWNPGQRRVNDGAGAIRFCFSTSPPTRTAHVEVVQDCEEGESHVEKS